MYKVTVPLALFLTLISALSCGSESIEAHLEPSEPHLVEGERPNIVYVFLDDGGAGPDNDYDDLLVRITVTGVTLVPEPGTLALLAVALLGAGIVTRRKRS